VKRDLAAALDVDDLGRSVEDVARVVPAPARVDRLVLDEPNLWLGRRPVPA